MKVEDFKSIQQCEAAKDVIWFLKGAISTNYDFSLSDVHVDALRDLVNYVYENEREKDSK